jgi:TfoX/Sxy family transcriptional regulator of competence genes
LLADGELKAMPTEQRTVDFLVEQLSDVGGISARKMFGEYGIFCDGKTVALVCDDKLFVKMTVPGRAFAVGAAELPPYPGAKPSLLIASERWDDRDWLVELFRETTKALPEPKPKGSKKR